MSESMTTHKRREAFESSRGPRTDLSRYQRGPFSGCYKNPVVEEHWKTWNSALDSVVVELPKPNKTYRCMGEGIGESLDSLDYSEVVAAIESAGVRVKS